MLEMSQRTAQLFDFVLVRIFLALREFERFEDFFHVIERFAKGFNNLIDVFDGALNGSGGSRLPRGRGRKRLDMLDFGCALRFRCCFSLRRCWIGGDLLARLFFGLRRRFVIS